MTEFYHKVTTEDEGKELREIMREHFDFSSRLRNRIKREKLVMVDGVSTPGWKKPVVGAEIRITLPDETSGFEPQNIPLDIVYEDDDLMIINKQPGLIVHPTKGHPTGTVANALMYYMEQTGKPFKIRFVNRLDMDTSGLLVVAKNSYTQNDYTKQMKENTVEKRYIAVVKGIVESDEGTIDLPIGRPDPDHVRRGVMENGAPSVTHYKVLDRYNGYSLVELLLETGRTHQIRVHMSQIGFPIVGDDVYSSGKNPFNISSQMLHAKILGFEHPNSKKWVEYEAQVPTYFENIVSKLTELK